MRKNRQTPTIKEVAQKAGVSISTVSNVLYGREGYYSPETANRVWQAVRSLGYRPNLIARSLARGRTFTIGIAVEGQSGGVSTNIYLALILDGILHYTYPRDYHVKIVRVNLPSTEKAFQRLEDGSVDGVVLAAPSVDSPVVESMIHSHLTSVIAGTAPPNSPLPCVDIDDFSATYEAVKWLISLGHRRIGIITGYMMHWSARRRLQGYLMALHDAGIEADPSWRYEGDYGVGSGKAGAQYMLQLHPRPTAVVCGNDGMALGALRQFQQAGLRVPEDISLLGFDDSEGAALANPPLTTIRQSPFDIGLRAAELLLWQIESGTRAEHHVLLPTELVIRESVMPPPDTTKPSQLTSDVLAGAVRKPPRV